ncbi:MAG: FAD-binding oxidoreductase [Candidatus Helarchaeota archaeon]
MLKSTEEHDHIKEELIKIVGEQWFSDHPEELLLYSYDMTENDPNEPEFVVMPQTPEEIQAILRLANETKTPVVPFVSGNNVGGLTIPLKKGIIIDLKRMDSIIHFNEDDMYVVIEPGVTFGHLNAFLKDTKFRYCYPFAPPYTSVIANALLDGLNNLSLRHGSMNEWINGIEAVLPNGDLVRIGTCSIWDSYDLWWSRNPLPDLLGLFTSWQGMTGIVTKMAVQVWPKRPIRDWRIILSFNQEETYKLVRRITHLEILNDILFLSIGTVKMIVGVPYGKAKHEEGEPHWACLIDFSANTTKEYEAKLEMINDEFKKLKEVDPKANIASLEAMAKLYGPKVEELKNLPITIAPMLEYGGLTWMGTYMTTKTETVMKGINKAFELIEKYNFEKCLYSRSMRGHHYFAFRFLLRFSKLEEGEIERMQKLQEELFESLNDLGAVPYKTPAKYTKKLINRMDKNWVKLMRTVKNTLDPNDIMNPGRWEEE